MKNIGREKVKTNLDAIKRLMRKDRGLKKQIVKQRREDEFEQKVKEWKSNNGSIKMMTKDRNWGYSPTSRSNVRPFKPQRLSEDYYHFNKKELNEIIEELER